MSDVSPLVFNHNQTLLPSDQCFRTYSNKVQMCSCSTVTDGSYINVTMNYLYVYKKNQDKPKRDGSN